MLHRGLATAVGASAGREQGREKITPEFPRELPTTQAVDRTQVDFESSWRLGVVFGRAGAAGQGQTVEIVTMPSPARTPGVIVASVRVPTHDAPPPPPRSGLSADCSATARRS
jgi:hypothetical protein